MKKFLIRAIFVALIPVSQAHAKSWFAEACEGLIGRGRPSIPERVQEVANLLNTQVAVANRFTSHPVEALIQELNFLADSPVGIVMKQKASGKVQWIKQPELEVFVNPKMLHLEWGDSKTGLGQAPGLLFLIENVKVKSAKGQKVLLTQLLDEEAGVIRERNPNLEFQLRSMPAADYPGLKFSGDLSNKIVVWVEGSLENFQAKRILLVSMETLFEHLVQDPDYARVLPK
jgi:hypothetical protein